MTSPGGPAGESPRRDDSGRSRREGARRARGSERLHTIGAAIVAILAVVAGILIINLLNNPSPKKHPPTTASAPTATASATPTSGVTSASASPSPSPPPSRSATPSGRPSAKPTAKPSAKPSTRAPAGPASIGPVAPVYVYNNSKISGLAAAAADRVRAVGFDVKGTNGISGRWPETTVYYDPPNEAAAHNLANRLGGVGRVQQRPSYVAKTGTLILIVTKDFPTDGGK